MKLSKFSKGITKIDKKYYQTTYIQIPEIIDFFIECPYCATIINIDNNDPKIVQCTYCKKYFYADYDINKLSNQL